MALFNISLRLRQFKNYGNKKLFVEGFDFLYEIT